MQAVEEALTGFFERVARREAVEIARLAAEPRFDLSDDAWHFALPDLHAHLQRYEPALGAIAYKRFRQALFNSPINRTVGQHGAKVTIADNTGKVDETRYALVWSSAAERRDPAP